MTSRNVSGPMVAQPAILRRCAMRIVVAVSAVILGLAALMIPAVTASAGSAIPTGIKSPNGSVLSAVVVNGQSADLVVHSASMNRDIPVSVLLPHDRSVPRPTLYLLNGAGGGEDAATWLKQSDAAEFFADKNVNVVIPEAGKFSYYTDWQKTDPVLGVNKWETFLTAELPPIINAALNTNQVNAIAGISSSATSVLNLTIHHPELYKAVGSYSGCAASASPEGRFYIRTVVEARGGGDTANMWGTYPDPDWFDNDAVINAEGLRGHTIYISNSSGLPGKYETPQYVSDPEKLVDQIGVGGVIEAATRACTQLLVDKLAQLRIPANYDFPPTGTHSWGYWQDELHKSWPILGAAIGAA